jgi:chromosome segregation ATPase
MEKMTMRANKKNFPFLLLAVFVLMLAGCAFLKEPVEAILDTGSGKSNSDSMAKRFQGSGPKAQSAVDSAIELAEKNSELSQEVVGLKQKVYEMTVENQKLKDNLAVLEPELKQTKKELTQANDLLVEMRIELNNWKNNVLGFRDEIRSADKVQLETLRRILEVLGGEIEVETSRMQDQNSTMVSLNKKK